MPLDMIDIADPNADDDPFAAMDAALDMEAVGLTADDVPSDDELRAARLVRRLGLSTAEAAAEAGVSDRAIRLRLEQYDLKVARLLVKTRGTSLEEMLTELIELRRPRSSAA